MSYKTTLIALYESKGVNCYKTSEYWEIGGMQALSGKRFYRETDWRTYSMVKKEKKKDIIICLWCFRFSPLQERHS